MTDFATTDPPEAGFNRALGSLAYGAANIGNLYRELTDDQAQRTLQAAWDAGIRYFDTAPHYGLGLSERRLGAFLRGKPRDEFVLSTKAGRLLRPNPAGATTQDTANDFAVPAALRRVWDFSSAGIRRSLEESLLRLGLDRVDILYLHDPEKYQASQPAASGLDAALAEGIPALATLRQEGLVSAIGVGSMSAGALEAAVRTDALDLVMVAGRFTLVDQSALRSVIPACRRRGIGVVAAAVFNSGLLATATPDPTGRFDYGRIPDQLYSRAARIAACGQDFGIDLPTLALQYTLREPLVRTVVAGGRNPQQVIENAARMRVRIPDELWQRLVTEELIPR
ncbi:MAG: aldo/keto reductase [Microbacteriaceae bacterium]